MRSMFNKAALFAAAVITASTVATAANAQWRDRDGDWRDRGDRDVRIRVYRDDDRVYRRDRAFRAFARDCTVKRTVRYTPRGKVVKHVRVCD